MRTKEKLDTATTDDHRFHLWWIKRRRKIHCEMSNATDDKSLVIYVMFLVEIEAFNHNILHSQVRNDIIIDC